MPEISYRKLKKHLSEKKKEPFEPVYLLYGEESIYKTTAETLINTILPDYKKSINFEFVDGANGNIQQAIDKANTFSLLSGTKVVALFDLPVFYSRQNKKQILEKAKKAYDKNDVKKAAVHIQHVADLLNISIEDMVAGNIDKIINIDSDVFDDTTWLTKTIEFCNDHHLSDSVIKDKDKLLQTAVEKGFPRKNHLIITTDLVDKRRGLYKIIKKKGIIVDCSVLKGSRREDRADQESVLYERMVEILSKTGKKIDKQTFAAIYDIIGFDIRTFSNSIEKLVNYSGQREQIVISDVQCILKRTKKDPVYEFTGAVTERKLEKAIFYLNSILSGGDIDHPLQLLAALINQFRKLMVIKDFVESSYGKNWQPGYPYYSFKNNMLPSIIEYDRNLLSKIQSWEQMFNEESIKNDLKKNKGEKLSSKKGKNKTVHDLLIVKNPNNTFPIYKMLQQSEKFTKKELGSFFPLFGDADKRLKTTGQNPKLILEDVVIKICRKALS